MSHQNKSIIGWGFVMVATPVFPFMAALVPEPSTLLVISVLVGIGIVSAVVGNLFKD